MVKEILSLAEEGVMRVMPEGKLVGDVAKNLEAYLASEEARRYEAITVDLQRVSIMSADGVRVLLNAHIDSQVTGIKLQLSNPNQAVNELLQTVGLAELIA